MLQTDTGYCTRDEKDPYEVFDYITENIEKHNADARFFFL